MSDEDPLDELIQDAEEQKEKTAREQQKSKRIKDELRDKVRELQEEDLLSEEEMMLALNKVDEAEYGKVRETIREARQGTSFQFEDEEKQAFAEDFKDAWDDLEESVEDIRNTLLDMQGGASRQDMKDMAYAKNSSLNKGEIEKIFSAIDKVTSSGVSTNKAARAVVGMNSSLRINDVENVLKTVKKQGEN